MNKFAEFLRLLLISPEAVILLGGVLLEFQFSQNIGQLISGSNPPDEIVKHLALLPAAAAGWMFFSGRALIFPAKDTKHLLQSWPDYWKLRIGFDVSIIYSVIFGFLGIIAWAMDWTSGKSTPYVSLATSLLGSGTCFVTVYRAQQIINEIIIQKGAKP